MSNVPEGYNSDGVYTGGLPGREIYICEGCSIEIDYNENQMYNGICKQCAYG